MYISCFLFYALVRCGVTVEIESQNLKFQGSCRACCFAFLSDFKNEVFCFVFNSSPLILLPFFSSSSSYPFRFHPYFFFAEPKRHSSEAGR